MVLFIPWRGLPSAAPDHARAGGHGARDQSDPLEPTGRRGGGWPNDGEVDVGGCRRFRLTIDIAGRTSRVLLLSLISRAAIQFGGERWSSGVRSERSCRPPRRRARAGRGSSPTAPIETALPGGPCASSLSHFSRQIRRQQTDPHPPPGRRCGCWPCRHGGMVLFIPWRVVPSAAPDHARAGGHGARDQSDPLEPTGRRGGGWPNDGEVDVGGCRRFRFNH